MVKLRRILYRILCRHVYYTYGYETSVSRNGDRENTIYEFKCNRCGEIRTITTEGHDYILTPEMTSSKKFKKIKKALSVSDGVAGNKAGNNR